MRLVNLCFQQCFHMFSKQKKKKKKQGYNYCRYSPARVHQHACLSLLMPRRSKVINANNILMCSWDRNEEKWRLWLQIASSVYVLASDNFSVFADNSFRTCLWLHQMILISLGMFYKLVGIFFSSPPPIGCKNNHRFPFFFLFIGNWVIKQIILSRQLHFFFLSLFVVDTVFPRK